MSAFDRHDLPPTGAPWTLLGPGCLCRGDLVLTGDVVLHGRLEGTLFTDGDVRVAPGATVEGGIHARVVTVEGSCRGRIEGAAAVRLRPGSVLRGEVETEVLEVADGARFAGDHHHPSGGPPEPKIAVFRDGTPGNA